MPSACLSSLAFSVFTIAVPGSLALALATSRPLRGYEPHLRVPLALLAAVALCVPLFYLRRFFPPVPFDLITSLLLPALAVWAWRRAALEVRSDLSRIARSSWALSAALLAAFVVARFGFEARLPEGLGYWGLYGPDFLNLCGIVTTIRESPFPPAFPVLGHGPLHYHWLVYAVPAWGSEYLGSRMRVSSALPQFSFLVAFVLLMTLRLQVARCLGSRLPTKQCDRSLMAVVLGSSLTYAFQAALVVSPAGADWFGPRNSLLLSPLNALLNFPSVCFALAAVLCLCSLLEDWNARPTRSTAILAALVAFMIAAGNVLVVPAVAAGALLLTILGKVERPLFLLSLVAAPLVAGATVLAWCQYFGGNTPQGLAFAPDGGRFLIRLTAASAALLVLVWQDRNEARKHCLALAVALASIVLPTLMTITGSATGSSDLSMKMATVFTVVLMPMSASSLAKLASAAPKQHISSYAVTLLLVIGWANSGAYLLQFPLARLGHLSGRWHIVPQDLASALESVRNTTARGTIIFSGLDRERASFDALVSLGERRIWIGCTYHNSLAGTPVVSQTRAIRLAEWNQSLRPSAHEPPLAFRTLSEVRSAVALLSGDSPLWLTTAPTTRFGAIAVVLLPPIASAYSQPLSASSTH